MTAVLAIAVRTAQLQVIADALDGGTLALYGGARPGLGGTPPGAQCLIPLGSPAATVTGATLSFPTLIEGLRLDNATITWGRFMAADGSTVMDCDVSSVSAGTGDIQLDNVNGITGAFVQITAGSITE